MKLGLKICAGLAAMMLAGEAEAQSYIRADCHAAVTAPRFDDTQHAQWYQRFWTGGCGSLLFCSSGAPFWNDVVLTLRSRAPAARASQVTRRACMLGQRIGQEWARDNGIRRINSNDLSSYVTTVQQAVDVEAGLARVEAAVSAKLGGR